MLAIVMVALIAAAAGLYRWLDTPRGRAVLLDAGFGDRFDGVQRGIEGALYDGLRAAGVDSRTISFEREDGGDGHAVMHVRAELPPDEPLVRVNAEVDGMLPRAGGRVRSCVERDGGRSMEMRIGTRRHETHVLVVRLSRREGKREPESIPGVAVIVDDFGFFFNSLVRGFLEVEAPITVSVIPGLDSSARICEAAAEAGKETICHLPMEPRQGADDYGEIPLVRVGMGGEEIAGVVERALETVPGVIGMNNHMGSLATGDRGVMEAVLGVCREKGLFFLDSKTTNASVVASVASGLGVRSLDNDLFIDNRDEDARENMRKLLAIAKRRGRAVGIMHVRKESLADLRWMVEESRRMGVQIIPVSAMVERVSLAMKKGGEH